MGIHLLTELGVQNKKKPGLYGDGGGLYLQVTKGKDDEPCRSWIFRYAVHTPVGPDEPAGGSPDKRKKSKERKMGLGPLDTVGLAEAREKALECRKLRDKGLDPIEEKARKNREAALQVVKNITFEEAVKAYIAAHKGEWRNAKHLQQWGTSLKTHCYPLLGNLMVRDIDSGLVVRVVEPMWRTIPTTASRVRGRIESVLDWGKANGYRTGENPAKWDDNLKHTLMDHKKADRKKLRKKKHHAALPHAQMPEFVVALRTRQTTAAQCLEFVILTAARSGEAIKAKWDEFSIDEKVWIVPAERMKGEREHRVPLSPAAIAVIERMQKVRCNDYVFAGHRPRQPISDRSLLKVVETMNAANTKAKLPRWTDPKQGGRDVTPHGFRSSFRDWVSDETNFSSELAEAAIAHIDGDEAEQNRANRETKLAYKRTDFYEKRRPLMTAWADHCNQPVDDAKVVRPKFGGFNG